MRTHYCGHVSEAQIGEEVELAGWMHRRRDHGGVIFIDLCDREGLVQVVFDPDRPDVFAVAEKVRGEYVLRVRGTVRPRPEGTVNERLASGGIEVLASEVEVLNASETPPFHHDESASEEIRLRYRYLDLRREEMTRNLRLRHSVTRAIRNCLDEQGFIDIADDGLATESDRQTGAGDENRVLTITGHGALLCWWPRRSAGTGR